MWRRKYTCPKLPWQFKVTSTHVHTSYAPKAQIFLSFSLCDQAFFRLCPGILRKVHQITPKMTLAWSRSKVPMDMHIAHIPVTRGCPYYRLFALLWAIFELWPNIEKNASNDLDMFKVKSIHVHTICTQGTNFYPFVLLWACFQLQPDLLEQCTEWMQNYFDIYKHYKVNSIHIYACHTYTHQAQISSYSL